MFLRAGVSVILCALMLSAAPAAAGPGAKPLSPGTGRAAAAGTPRVEAAEVTGATAIKLDGEFTRRRVGARDADHGVRAARPEGRRGAVVPDRGARRCTTRRTSTSPCARFDTEPGEDRRHPHAARLRVALRLDPRDHRLVPRPAHRVRVRGEPGRREAGPLLVQRRQPATRAGTRSGTSRSRSDDAGLERRVPHSVLAAALRAGQARHVRLRRGARDRPAERDVDVAAARRRARTGFVSRSANWAACTLASSPKRLEVVPYAVGRRDDAAGAGRQPVRQVARSGDDRSAPTSSTR